MKKFFLVLFIILAIYLNRAYAHFYDSIQSQHLQSPNFKKVTLIKNELSPQYKNRSFEFLSNDNNQGLKKTFKYVALGDSLTAGVGVKNYQETLPYLISKNLEKNNSNISLINLAKSGATTRNVIESQLPAAIAENPDFITVFIGVNDIHGLISQEEFKNNYVKIISKLSSGTSARIVIINLPYLGSNKLAYFPYNYLLDLRTKQFNFIIESIAQRYSVRQVDLYNKSRNVFAENPMLYSEDQFHPSFEGYKLWAEQIDAN